MKKIEITDSREEHVGLNYVYASIQEILKDFGGQIVFKDGEVRQKLTISCPDNYYDLYKSEIEDKIADVIAIKYKYCFLKRVMRTIGLSSYQNEILFSTIISADIDDDRRYIIRKLKSFDDFAIDGIFHFRLQPLQNKWKEVASYIPIFFSENQLCDFTTYVLGEKRGGKVLVDGECVYDDNFNTLKRSSLISPSPDRIKEILLSSRANVEVIKAVSENEAMQLKRYFGRRVSFLKGSLPKMVDKKN